MATIKISLEGAPGTKQRIVVTGGKGGNLVVDPGEDVAWTSEVRGTFKIYFEDMLKGGKTFPFASGDSDGEDTTKGHFLRVGESGKSCTVDGGAPIAIKYLVVAENLGNVDDLDPVIIIRPPPFKNWMLGLIWMVLGAVLGAAVALLFCP